MLTRLAIAAVALAVPVITPTLLRPSPRPTAPARPSTRLSGVTSPLVCELNAEGVARCQNFEMTRMLASDRVDRLLQELYAANPELDRRATALIDCGDGNFATSNVDLASALGNFADAYSAPDQRQGARDILDGFIAGGRERWTLPGQATVPEFSSACASGGTAGGSGDDGGTSGSGVTGPDPFASNDSTHVETAVDRVRARITRAIAMCYASEGNTEAARGVSPGTASTWLDVISKSLANLKDAITIWDSVDDDDTAEEKAAKDPFRSVASYDEVPEDVDDDGEPVSDRLILGEYEGTNSSGEKISYTREETITDHGSREEIRCSVDGERACTDAERATAEAAIEARKKRFEEQKKKKEIRSMLMNDELSKCEQMEGWWMSLEERCAQSNWQTPECANIMRKLNGCPDETVILPGPDTHFGCLDPDDGGAAYRREQCERESGVMLCKGGECTCKASPFSGGVPMMPRPDRCGVEMLCVDHDAV